MTVVWEGWTSLVVIFTAIFGGLSMIAAFVSAHKAWYPAGSADSVQFRRELARMLTKISGKLALDPNLNDGTQTTIVGTMERVLNRLEALSKSSRDKQDGIVRAVEKATEAINKGFEAQAQSDAAKKRKDDLEHRVFLLEHRAAVLQRSHARYTAELSELVQKEVKTDFDLERETELRNLRDQLWSKIRSADDKLIEIIGDSDQSDHESSQ